jgi:hypothetical protein
MRGRLDARRTLKSLVADLRKTTLVLFAALLIGLGLCVWMPNFIMNHFAFE